MNGIAPALSVTFQVGTQVIGSAPLVDAGNGTLEAVLEDVPLLEPDPFGTLPTGQMKPGNRTVTAFFEDVDSNFEVEDATTTLVIQKEDARATYTGPMFVGTSSSTSSTANVTLSATIQDISAVTGSTDLDPGDIRNATVSFIDRDAGNALLCSPMSIVPLDPANPQTGTATCSWAANLGSADSKNYRVGIVVNNYYTRNDPADDTVVTVSKPIGTNFITGGGYLQLASSAGQYAGDPGSKNNFGFNVKYNKSKTNLQGNLNTIIRRGARMYQLKSTNMISLAVQTTTVGGTATFQSKANLQDVTDPTAPPIPVSGNGSLTVTMTDNGEPGASDKIGITLHDNGGALLFSSEWSGTKTVQKLLKGGNLVVH